jgi:hypothetical protein
MTTNRMLLRTVLPPVLAVGLVALVVHPLQAVQVPGAALASARSLAPAPAQMLAATSSSPAPGSVSAVVPAVAFQQHAVLAHGHLRTAVLINIAMAAGTATIEGIPGCSVQAPPGVPVWIDCATQDPSPSVRVDVTLTDGRAFQDSLPVMPG